MMRLKREMSGIEEVNIRIRIVALKSFGSWREEERIVFSPDREQRWLLGSKIVLKLR
jgi:hypothetical protein